MIVDSSIACSLGMSSPVALAKVVHKAAGQGASEVCLVRHATSCTAAGAGALAKASAYAPAGMKVTRGIMVDAQAHRIAEAQRAIDEAHEADVIMLYADKIMDEEVAGSFTVEHDAAEAQQRYYMELCAVVDRLEGWDALALVDLVRRYTALVPFEQIKPFVVQILKSLISHNCALAIDGSCVRSGLTRDKALYDILALYRELGGSFITVGSLATESWMIGRGVDELEAMLQELGFEGVYSYHEHKAVFHGFANGGAVAMAS
ncbi:hypothetical protein AAK684_02915 [Leptogranulimonas caecicola]|uniref:hypothetical protein n=1 Tax=Leptogranulimonas caecicola TaxID=2894156 RepID=UPI001BF07646|nr:hypothetical protein [Leptogranulimonas caecicola]BCV18972.1 hypothetical protein ATOBIA_N12620 [Atopobiaceae bacterium P1]